MGRSWRIVAASPTRRLCDCFRNCFPGRYCDRPTEFAEPRSVCAVDCHGVLPQCHLEDAQPVIVANQRLTRVDAAERRPDLVIASLPARGFFSRTALAAVLESAIQCENRR